MELAMIGMGATASLGALPLSPALKRRASVALSLRGTSGERVGEGKSNKNATPLPGPLLLLRRKRGRRAHSVPLIQCQWSHGERVRMIYVTSNRIFYT